MAIIALAVAIIAWSFPDPVSAVVKTSYVNILLGIVMFGMGMTLKLADFKVVFTKPESCHRGHPGAVRYHAGAGVPADDGVPAAARAGRGRDPRGLVPRRAPAPTS